MNEPPNTSTLEETLAIKDYKGLIDLKEKGIEWIKIPLFFIVDNTIPFLANIIHVMNEKYNKSLYLTISFNYYLSLEEAINIVESGI